MPLSGVSGTAQHQAPSVSRKEVTTRRGSHTPNVRRGAPGFRHPCVRAIVERALMDRHILSGAPLLGNPKQGFDRLAEL